MKKTIKFLYENEKGIKIYQFEFLDEIVKNNEHLRGVWEGVIAQDLIDSPFEFALNLEDDGYFVVDYDKLEIELKKISNMGKIHLLKQIEGGKYTPVVSNDIDSTLEEMNESLSDKLEVVISSKEFEDVSKILLIFIEKMEKYKIQDNWYEFNSNVIDTIRTNFLNYNENN